MNIPIVDFSKCGLFENDDAVTESDLLTAGKKLYDAFSTAGFAYISNHGITEEVTRKLNQVGEKFFEKPIDYKMKFCSKGLGLCYDPYKSFQANLNRPHDLNEGMRFPAYKGDVEWPDVPGLTSTVTEMHRLCKKLLMRVLKALGRAMKLQNPDLFAKSHELIGKEGNTTCFRLIHYPPIAPDVEIFDNQIRCGEHTDFGSITFLFQDEIGGLQVKNSSGKFFDVTPIPGNILINVGEMLHYWSGRRLKATVHRVVNPTDESKKVISRRSLAYFVNVDDDVLLEELDFNDNVEKDEMHKAITSQELFKKLFALKCFNQNVDKH